MQLSVEEQQLCERLDFHVSVAQALKAVTKHPIEQARETVVDLGQTQPAQGLSSAVDGDFLDCVLMVEQVRAGLPEGWQAFYSTRDSTSNEQQEIVVLHTKDDVGLAALHFRSTHSANYDTSTDDIIAKLQEWKTRSEFEVVGAATDYVALEFQTLPSNICAFAEEVYRFCPDAVEQGVGLMEEEEDPEFFAQARALCPTISAELHTFIETELRNDPEEDETEDDLAEAIEEIELGIRLLANHLNNYKSLFLWWD